MPLSISCFVILRCGLKRIDLFPEPKTITLLSMSFEAKESLSSVFGKSKAQKRPLPLAFDTESNSA